MGDTAFLRSDVRYLLNLRKSNVIQKLIGNPILTSEKSEQKPNI